MSLSFKVSIPQANPAAKALQLSDSMPDQNNLALPSRVTFIAVSALPVYILHSAAIAPENYPTVADVLTMGAPCSASVPLVLQTTELDSPTLTNGAQIFVAVATGATAGDLRVIG